VHSHQSMDYLRSAFSSIAPSYADNWLLVGSALVSVGVYAGYWMDLMGTEEDFEATRRWFRRAQRLLARQEEAAHRETQLASETLAEAAKELPTPLPASSTSTTTPIAPRGVYHPKPHAAAATYEPTIPSAPEWTPTTTISAAKPSQPPPSPTPSSIPVASVAKEQPKPVGAPAAPIDRGKPTEKPSTAAATAETAKKFTTEIREEVKVVIKEPPPESKEPKPLAPLSKVEEKAPLPEQRRETKLPLPS